MKTHRLFNLVSLTAILVAHGAWQMQRPAGFDLRGLVVLALVYGFSGWLRERFYDEKTTFFDADSRALPGKDESLIIFGEQVEDLAQESRERRLLISLVDFGGQKYKIYLAWLGCIAVSVYLQFRLGGLDIVEAGASILILTGIYFSPFLNQQLVPLFVAFAMALFAFGRSSELKVTLAFGIFLALFLYAIVLFRDVTPDRVNPERKFSGRKRLRSVGLLVLAVIAIYGIVDYLVPEESPFHSKGPRAVIEPPKTPRLSTDRISRQFAEQMVKFGERSQDATTGPTGDQSGLADEGSGAGGKSDRGGKGDGAPQARGGRGDERRDQPSQGPSESRAAAEKTAGSANPSGPQGKDENVSNENQKSQPSSAAGPDPSGADPAGPPHSASKSVPESAPSGAPNGEGSPNPKSAAGESGPTAGAPSLAKPGQAPAVSVAEKQKEREKKIEDLQKDLKLPLELAKGFVFLILAAVAVFALFRYLSKKKPAEKEIQTQHLTSKQRHKLQTLLQRIMARNLSPADEIVETYNLLLTVFELGHHPREEWLPAEDFSNQISESIPTLKAPFEGATDRFSRTLYGRKNVGDAELAKFRGEVAKILQFFQLS